MRTIIGREDISHLGQIAEAGDELRVVVDHRVLDVKIEHLQTGFKFINQLETLR